MPPMGPRVPETLCQLLADDVGHVSRIPNNKSKLSFYWKLIDDDYEPRTCFDLDGSGSFFDLAALAVPGREN